MIASVKKYLRKAKEGHESMKLKQKKTLPLPNNFKHWNILWQITEDAKYSRFQKRIQLIEEKFTVSNLTISSSLRTETPVGLKN